MASHKKKPKMSNKVSSDELINYSAFDKRLQKKKITTSSASSNKIMAYGLVAVIVFGMLLGFGVFSGGPNIATDNDKHVPHDNWTNHDTSGDIVLLYSSPDCECCSIYVDYLMELGYEVEFKRTNYLYDLKDDLGIPAESHSCHTAKWGQYFVEGHIPIEVISKLKQDRPDIDGISLPGMPAGSPGMPGEKAGTWEIHAIHNGEIVDIFMEY